MEERKRSRCLSSPTGVTPKQKAKHQYVQRQGEQTKGKKRLSFGVIGSSESSVSDLGYVSARNWIESEDKGLVEFILLTTPGNSWPQSKQIDFWNSAALFVHQRCSAPKRTCKQTL